MRTPSTSITSVRAATVGNCAIGPNGGEVGLATIGRNLGLIVLAMFGWLASLSVPSALAGPSLWLVLIAVAYALGVAMLSALRFAWPHFTLTEDRLRVGGEAGE